MLQCSISKISYFFHPYSSCLLKLPKAYRGGKAGRCLLALPCETEFRTVIHLSSGEVVCKLICKLCDERTKVM
ncbi:hypothetical protein Peur_058365 [Populus x canadensis]